MTADSMTFGGAHRDPLANPEPSPISARILEPVRGPTPRSELRMRSNSTASSATVWASSAATTALANAVARRGERFRIVRPMRPRPAFASAASAGWRASRSRAPP